MVLPVEVLTVQAESLALSSELPGRIEPVRVAEVRARVAGIVVQKRFEEGADVKAGDLLFQIDPAPLKAAVSRAEGELARNRAVLFEAQARVRRYEPLVKTRRSVSRTSIPPPPTCAAPRRRPARPRPTWRPRA